MNLSIFKGWTDETPVSISLDAIVEMMRTDASLKDLTEKHRYYLSIGNKTSAKYYKQRMPCFAVAVRFEGGKSKEHIAALTGLTIVDIDNIAPDDMSRTLTLIKQDSHTLLAYTTISGKGIRVISRYAFNVNDNDNDDEKIVVGCTKTITKTKTDHPASALSLYKESFLQVNAYYAGLTGLQPDPLCKNITRLSGVAYDADLCYNPDATPFEIKVEEKRRVGRPRAKRTAKLAEREVFRQIEQRGIRYEPGSHNRFISQAGYLMNRYGIEEADCVEWATARFADYAATGNNVAGIIHSCYQQTAEHGTQELPRRSVNRATVYDIVTYLRQQDVRTRYNLITRKREIWQPETAIDQAEPSNQTQNDGTWVELSDDMVKTLYCNFCIETGLVSSPNEFFNIIESDFSPAYHPLRTYLDNLPPWDGHDYIDDLASMVHVRECDQEMHNRYFKKWFVAMIAAWCDDGKVNHEILTYIGEQGKYKTSFVTHLLPPALADYFAMKSVKGLSGRDERLSLTELGLVALDDMDIMTPGEVVQLKALVTAPSENLRPVYVRYSTRRPHIASFCATGNNERFLVDLTGNRRWLPFLIESIDSPFDHHYPYVGIYAQAYHLWRTGFCYWLNEEENAEISRHNIRFEELTIEEELVYTYLRVPYENERGEFLTIARIIELIGHSVRVSLDRRKVARAMHKLGFVNKRRAHANGWIAVILTGDEIKNRQRLDAH
ncbi:MAG: hypothetical protein IKJ09_05765 [Bacteroidaceae bacterium]|nr:hypothetical protein [Bacteroidaceae bacterium]